MSAIINGIVKYINDPGLGVPVGDTSISLLLYTDDIIHVLIADSESKLQTILDTIHEWHVLIITLKYK